MAGAVLIPGNAVTNPLIAKLDYYSDPLGFPKPGRAAVRRHVHFPKRDPKPYNCLLYGRRGEPEPDVDPHSSVYDQRTHLVGLSSHRNPDECIPIWCVNPAEGVQLPAFTSFRMMQTVEGLFPSMAVSNHSIETTLFYLYTIHFQYPFRFNL